MDLFKDIPWSVRDEIKTDIIIAVGVSPAGAVIPLLDMGAITALWAKMLYKIGKIHNVELDEAKCIKIIAACGAGFTAYLGGGKLLNWL